MKLSLSFGSWDYDRIRPLTDGIIQAEGIELNWLNMPVEETFFRMMRHEEFDVAELSLSSYLIAKDRGMPNFTAIPVFLSRMFRHSGIFINTNSGIMKPEDLIGKKVGIPEYQLSACVWVRGILNDYYGVKRTDVEWFVGGEEKPGRIEKLSVDLPEDIKIRPIGEFETLNKLLEEGSIDAFIGPRAPSSFLKGSPNVERLFEDYVTVEKEYYKQTGIFPIMHVVAIKDEILEKHPWVSKNLYQAFLKSKEIVYEGYEQTAALKAMVPWLIPELERTREILGEDFWSYGLEKNYKTLEAMIRYSYEDGLIKQRLKPEDIFAKSTLEEFVI